MWGFSNGIGRNAQKRAASYLQRYIRQYATQPEKPYQRQNMKGPRTTKQFSFWKPAAVTCIVSAIGCASLYYAQKAGKRQHGALGQAVTAGKARLGGPWSLVDENGTPRTSAHYHGKYPLIYFGFTFCPDICPIELHKMCEAVSRVERRLGSDKSLVQPMFISVDPQRDTIAQVREYTKEFHPRLLGLTGTPEQINGIKRKFRVYSANEDPVDADQDDYVVDHTIFTYLMDKKGEFVQYYGVDARVEDIEQGLISVLKENGDVPKTILEQIKEFLNID